MGWDGNGEANECSILARKPLEKPSFGRQRIKWEKIKMNVMEIYCENER
jgi:hypothetical protein